MNLLWIVSASALGFCIAAIFAGALKLKRNIYLLVYIPAILGFIVWFLFSKNIDVRDLLTLNWYWGLAGALAAGAFVIKNVYTQPSSKRNTGFGLFIDITWAGVAYGLADALLLSVLPVLAVRSAFADTSIAGVWYGKIIIGLLALSASSFVTTAYHIGYPEFRGKNIIWPNIGNGVLTIAYILTLNPLAAVLPHIAMHVTAMIHGRESTGQVPPHYNLKPEIR